MDTFLEISWGSTHSFIKVTGGKSHLLPDPRRDVCLIPSWGIYGTAHLCKNRMELMESLGEVRIKRMRGLWEKKERRLHRRNSMMSRRVHLVLNDGHHNGRELSTSFVWSVYVYWRITCIFNKIDKIDLSEIQRYYIGKKWTPKHVKLMAEENFIYSAWFS